MQCEQQPGAINLISAERVVYYDIQQNEGKADHHSPQLPNSLQTVFNEVKGYKEEQCVETHY